ncbi:MAG: beta-ketoacyl-ACP synthase III [Kiritimatiellia bacterium]
MSGSGKTGGKGVRIAGTGSYLPERVLTNSDLEKMVDTSDEWIRTRTGISARHLARDEEATSGMASAAALRALESAGMAADELDLITVGTITPDMFFPCTACFVQDMIKAPNAFCFDLSAACSGFLYGLETARHLISGGSVRNALVIGAEKLSCVTDWEDRATCVLFGDGAGAVVLRAEDNTRGIIASSMGSDGGLADLLKLPGGGSRNPVTEATMRKRMHYMKMTGNEVFKHAVRCMCEAGLNVLEKAGMTIEDIDWVIPHQANMRIIRAIANRLGGSLEKFYVNLDRVGNMSAASVPVALDEAVRAGRIRAGQKILFIVFGGGFTWGAMVMEW